MDEENIAKNYKDQGNKEFKAGNYASAIDYYTKAIEVQKDKTFYTNRATCFFNMNKFNKCISDCEEAIKLDGKFAKAYMRKSEAQQAVGKLQEAVDTLNKAIELKVEDPEIRNRLNDAKVQLSYRSDYDVAYEKKDWDTCIRKLDCLLEKCTHYRELIIKKIEILLYQGKVQEAIDFVKKHQSEYGSYSDFKYITGLAYLYKGQSEHALNVWREGAQNDQDFTGFREGVKRWKQGNALKDEGTELFKANKYEQALAKYKQAAEVDEHNKTFNSSVHMNIGTCLMKQNKLKEAIKEFNKSIDMNPNYAKAYMKRSDCHEKLGNFVQAEQDLRQAQHHDSSLRLDNDIKNLTGKAKTQSKKDYYKILGVEKNSSEADIKKAFKKKTLEFHPDRHAGATEEEKKEMELKFKEANEAYSVLSDPKKKQQFDAGGYDPNGGDGGSHFDGGGFQGFSSQGMDLNDLFAQMGGGGMGGGGMGGMPGFFQMFGGAPGGAGGGRGGRGGPGAQNFSFKFG